MAAEEKLAIVKDTAEAMGAILDKVPIYADAVQPAAQEAGKALAAPIRLLNSALRPLQTLMLGWNLVFDRLDARLQEKLKDVPADRLHEAPPVIAGPLLLHYPFVESEEPLREMFEELLVTAMLGDTRADAHPSFVEVVKQLTPDEARLIRHMHMTGRDDWPLLQAIYVHQSRPGFIKGPMLSTFSIEVGLAGPDHAMEAIDNLLRLRLVELPETERLASDAEYESIRLLPYVGGLKDWAAEAQCTLELVPKVLVLTRFGQRFMRACVRRRQGLS